MIAVLLLLAGLQTQSDSLPELSAQEIFNRVREGVTQQIQRSVNYTCVLTVDRSYSVRKSFYRSCETDPSASYAEPFMHDKLRLDVADLNGQEIFSWHGSKQFANGGVDEVVKTGPISSGTFVGYLQNIFFTSGIQIRMVRDKRFGDALYHFEYEVPLSRSGHYVSTGRGLTLSAYAGSFSADPQTFELVQLSAVINKPPRNSRLCHVRSVIEYQTAPIAGVPARIPKRFTLEINDDQGLYTASRSEYVQCRAFTGESTLSFDTGEAGTRATREEREERLPPGMSIPVKLKTPIDDIKSFTGDPVEGVLARDVKMPGRGDVLPKGSAVSGYISRLENRYLPSRHVTVGVHFNQLSTGDRTYIFDAQLDPGIGEMTTLRQIYGRRSPDEMSTDVYSGVLVFPTSHVHLDQRFTAEWKTIKAKQAQKR